MFINVYMTEYQIDATNVFFERDWILFLYLSNFVNFFKDS